MIRTFVLTALLTTIYASLPGLVRLSELAESGALEPLLPGTLITTYLQFYCCHENNAITIVPLDADNNVIQELIDPTYATTFAISDIDTMHPRYGLTLREDRTASSLGSYTESRGMIQVPYPWEWTDDHPEYGFLIRPLGRSQEYRPSPSGATWERCGRISPDAPPRLRIYSGTPSDTEEQQSRQEQELLFDVLRNEMNTQIAAQIGNDMLARGVPQPRSHEHPVQATPSPIHADFPTTHEPLYFPTTEMDVPVAHHHAPATDHQLDEAASSNANALPDSMPFFPSDGFSHLLLQPHDITPARIPLVTVGRCHPIFPSWSRLMYGRILQKYDNDPCWICRRKAH